MSAVELRYAEALYNAAGPKSSGAAGAACGEFSALLKSQGELREFLLDPTIPASVKKETYDKLMPDLDAPLVKNFIYLLIDKGRLALLPGICAAYIKLDAERRHNPDINIYSALPLDEGQITKIRDKYRKLYNIPSAPVRLYIEPGLLGGVLIQIGDIRIDATLLKRLNGLRESLERK